MTEDRLSKISVTPEGGFLDLVSCRKAIITYWKLNKEERERFRIMIEMYPDCPEKYKSLLADNGL